MIPVVDCLNNICIIINLCIETAVVAQSVRAFVSHAEGWVFESQQRQSQVVKTGSDSSTAKRSAVGVSTTGPQR